MVDTHCSTLEALEHFEGVLIVLVGDVRVGKHGVECILGSDLLLIHFLPAIHVLAWRHALANQKPHICCLETVELLAEAKETLQSRLLDILGEGGET